MNARPTVDGVPDDCDLANGTSEECNGNGVVDVADLLVVLASWS